MEAGEDPEPVISREEFFEGSAAERAPRLVGTGGTKDAPAAGSVEVHVRTVGEALRQLDDSDRTQRIVNVLADGAANRDDQQLLGALQSAEAYLIGMEKNVIGSADRLRKQALKAALAGKQAVERGSYAGDPTGLTMRRVEPRTPGNSASRRPAVRIGAAMAADGIDAERIRRTNSQIVSSFNLVSERFRRLDRDGQDQMSQELNDASELMSLSQHVQFAMQADNPKDIRSRAAALPVEVRRRMGL